MLIGPFLIQVLALWMLFTTTPQHPEDAGECCNKGKLLYENALSSDDLLRGWVMEGPGETECKDGWMRLYAPEQEWHHVLWCPVQFPSRFIAEWEVQNLNVDAGLLIVFFAAEGTNGEDIFDSSLPPREGTFKNYTKDRINSYHVSYYANNPKNPERELEHLRKNNAFALVQTGEDGIANNARSVYLIRLIKDDEHICFYVDDRKIIDWRDDGKTYGPAYGEGKIGFRQMQWSNFRYRNFKVWSIK